MLGRVLAGVCVLGCLAGTARAETLKVWTISFSDVAMSALKGMIADWTAAHPGTAIDLEARGTDEHKSAMRVAINSGVGPDIYYMWGGLGLGGEFVLAGASAPLDAAYAKYHWDQRFVPAALIDTKRYKGQRHGVPFLIHAQGFYFNQALFKKAGIAGAPATYDELVADARKLKAAGIPAIVFGGSVNWHLMRLMDVILEAECGATTHDALTSMTASWAATPCAAASFGQLKLWTSEFTLQPFMGLADDQAQGLFYAGRTAMALEGDWFVSMLRDHDVDGIGFFQPPTGTHRLYFFSEQLYVGARSAHKDEDEQFLDFITSPAEQQKYVGKMSAVSVDRGIDYGKLDDPLDVALRAALSSSDATYANGDQAFPLDVTTEYWRVINLVAEGTMEPAAAAADMQDFIARRHH